jgi:hypothetical protein
MSSLYKRGNMWWVKSYRAGRMVRQSLGTRDRAEATRRMREREAQTTDSSRLTTSQVTWDTAASDLMAYYRAYGTRNTTEAGYVVKRLTPNFCAKFQGFQTDQITLSGTPALAWRRGETPSGAA